MVNREDYRFHQVMENGVSTTVERSEAEIDARFAEAQAWEVDTETRRVKSFDDFESRFTTAEWDAAIDYVYEANTTTGKPKRRALIQGIARVQARNKIDLLDVKTVAFMDQLISGGVITTDRKDAILNPLL